MTPLHELASASSRDWLVGVGSGAEVLLAVNAGASSGGVCAGRADALCLGVVWDAGGLAGSAEGAAACALYAGAWAQNLG
jgi:hypothetical protein